MSRLARWCFDHRRRVVVIWLLAAVVLLGVSRAAGSNFTAALSLPNTDSQAAVSLLTQNFPAAAGEGDQVVIQATAGAAIDSAPVRAAVTAALDKVAKVPGVASVASPYAADGAGQISRDDTIAFARVTWDTQSASITTADADHLITTAESADGPDVHVSVEGQSITNSERPTLGASVAVGVVAALIILLLIFGGAVLASLLPLAGTAVALVIGLCLVRLLTHAFDVASQSIDLAVLIGLGVGVDYGLFIISRHRGAVKAGRSYREAAAEAANTSGRTVLFAGATVCIALLGQFALGVNFLYGPSAAAAIAVALTMVSSLTFLPAMLGFLGAKVLSRKERAALAGDGPAGPGAAGLGLRWARFVEARRALVALGALVVVVVIALPVRNQLIPRAGQGTSLVVHVGGETATNIDFSHVLGGKLPLFIAVVVLLAFVLLAAVFRSLLIPVVASVLNLLSVGAALGAINAVFNWGWGASLLGLTGTGPIDAFLPVIMFSVLFGLSMDYEVFTVGRMHEEWRRLHRPGTGDIASGGREVQFNHLAVALGQAKSNRIIIAAAGIMILVFGSFLLGGHRLLQEFGFGLAFAVLIDALVIRSLLLPAVMHLIGPANWALPNRLDHMLPHLDIEPGQEEDPDLKIGEGMDAIGIG